MAGSEGVAIANGVAFTSNGCARPRERKEPGCCSSLDSNKNEKTVHMNTVLTSSYLVGRRVSCDCRERVMLPTSSHNNRESRAETSTYVECVLHQQVHMNIWCAFVTITAFCFPYFRAF